ncbi:efflux transporter outer membrane subunit [Pseudoduganella plicata]|uniref:Efflux transporter outer membrane subunit n=1 Tax=Pseudoduganella plicata TaxID=321984 RepID=A0A4P7BCT3_9BURK|nr:efflux transporter outer membrane subunit [Pseudoduganella plicata]QBQ35990.1 efflux transporter outer membrane subunit [Pseudoduganella plicata]GGY78906.1 RND transporter [Pseudoduganella plicata]
MKKNAIFRPTAIACLVAALSGCAVGPKYEVPATANPAHFKEAEGWVPAAPADALDRGHWWTLFGDATLNELAAAIDVNNQNVAAAVAAYAQARAVVAEQRAALFPVVSLSGSGTRSGGGDSRTANNYRVNIGGSWEPDIWGRLRAGVTGAQASAQASAAELASARLSAQGELVANYIGLRQTDAQLEILNTTVEGYKRVLQITQNRFNAGITARSDLLQAQTQLSNTQADQLTLIRQRALYEHAIAILLGKAPADFTLPAAPWTLAVPEVPVGVPSALLQRRPDIAAAERRVAIANEQIGIARAAYFPSLSLSASYGYGASQTAGLFNASNNLWSLGVSAAQAIFNAGAISSRVEQTRAARDVAIAQYRQTVLNAFADIEDQLSATRTLAQQQELRRAASEAADQVEQQMINRYRAGQVNYTEVVNAQVTALSARRAMVQVQADRQTTAVALIQALGGGWHAE